MDTPSWRATARPRSRTSQPKARLPRPSPRGRRPAEASSLSSVAKPEHEPSLRKDQLAADVKKGLIDTVVVAFTDMQGRLMGKRIDAEYFMESAGHGESVEGCNYLLALDMEMDPVPGYEMANWERGYGDFKIVPDISTLRRTPWLEGTALVL